MIYKILDWNIKKYLNNENTIKIITDSQIFIHSADLCGTCLLNMFLVVEVEMKCVIIKTNCSFMLD